jgi:Ca2+/H+ antiporter, TMEM165/GDT1 family
VNVHRVGWALRIFALVVLAVAALGLATMGLWNWLVPELFGGHPIDFVQAVGLLILCRLLFGGLRGGPGRHLHWRARLAERLEQMSPEQREKFRAGLRSGCGWRSAPEKEPESHSGAT